jgi:RNA polymerase sigma factor (sigma-70 family)
VPAGAGIHAQATLEGKPPDDLDLLHRIGKGDRDAWESLFVRWSDRLRSVALAILRDPLAADDATTEAILRIRRRASDGQVPSDAGEAARWILKQGRTCALNQLRGTREVHTSWLDHTPADSRTGSESDWEDASRARMELIERALRRVPRKARDALLMHYLQNLSPSEIAVAQGGTASGASSRITRATLRLIALIHARKIAGAESSLSVEERSHVLDVVAAKRARHPDIGRLALAREVCLQTGIYIGPESRCVNLLGTTAPRRAQ